MATDKPSRVSCLSRSTVTAICLIRGSWGQPVMHLWTWRFCGPRGRLITLERSRTVGTYLESKPLSWAGFEERQ